MLGLLLTAGVDPKNLGWFSLFIFLIVVGCVLAFAILHPALPIPFTSPRRYIHLDHAHPPLAGVLLLWIVQSTDWHTIWIGIAGEGTVEPYSILILFNALAYVCISVDQTGVFAWIAIKIARKAGSSGSKLFLYFYATASVMAIVTSNDVTILTLTPIIYYTCICTDQPPLPFLIAEYYAANIWSMTLYISSPTNIIVAQAEQVTFLEYMQWMLLPSIVSGCSTYVMLYWWFRHQINPTFAPLAVDERMALVDIRGAIFGSINLSINLFLLIIAQELKPLELWHICLFHGVVQLIYNIYAYTYHSHELPPLPPSEAEREAKYRAVTAAGEAGELSQIANENGEEEEIALNGQERSEEMELQSPATAHAKRNSLLQTQQQPQQQQQQQQEEEYDEHDDDRVQADEVQMDDEPEIDSRNGRSEQTDRLNVDESSHHPHYDLQHEQAVARLRDQLRVRLTVWSAINSMPWRIIPYAGGMFILVNILKAGGWLDLLSQGLASACYSTGSCVWTFSWLSIFLDNTINDQPMSILLSYVLLNDNFISGVEGGEKGSAFRGAMWSTIMASNLGACFTLIGALAGLMWAAILAEKGIKITFLQFAAFGFLLIPVCIVTTFAVQIELL